MPSATPEKEIVLSKKRKRDDASTEEPNGSILLKDKKKKDKKLKKEKKLGKEKKPKKDKKETKKGKHSEKVHRPNSIETDDFFEIVQAENFDEPSPKKASKKASKSSVSPVISQAEDDSLSFGRAKEDFFNNYKEPASLKTFSALEIDKFLQQNCITLEGSDCNKYKPARTFQESGLPEDIIRAACSDFKTPTSIQSQCWPIVLSGRDIVGIAATGSGKTIAFLLPALVHVREKSRLQSGIIKGSSKRNNKKNPSILILSPTRELALQSADICEKTCSLTGLQSACLYGGVPKQAQKELLRKGVDIVIGTPGRLLDLMQEESLSLAEVTYLVLDEADRMLDMGFEPDIRALVQSIASPRRQTLMFSATWPNEIRKLASEYLSNPVRVTIGSQDLSANHNVTQIVEVLEPHQKDSRLQQLLMKYHNKQQNKVLIFALYKKEAARLEYDLNRNGWKVQALHGDMTQSARTSAMNAFREGKCRLLVATDVAARGLDIDDVEYVINYTFPLTVEDYVHRIGRTGRAGKKGISHTFFTSYDKQHAAELVTILQEAKQEVPSSMMQFGMASKRKEHKLYGAHFKDVDTTAVKATHTKFTYDDDD